ncbi:hypothetical protein Cni_G06244 [Canna indica]|uniref:Reverse transcriptase domain-containing protein n=1 Tax=Canna indica TaxID=4628 RepID=A0AAQ3JWY3_9LILI|nr:hypothetical protein Cni_G06244 [Canna indica]
MYRLQPIMYAIISDNQSAFIKSRLISNNILIAHELMHHLKSKKNGSSQEMAIKLDLNKAYGQVEWMYLKLILSKMGFHHFFIEILMQCITTTSFSIPSKAVHMIILSQDVV